MPTSPPFDLKRFTLAQENHGSFAQAISELRAGRKTSHWVWWVFPQLAGLGTSGTAVRYALSGRDEACAYLADEVLRSRLAEAVTAAHDQLLGPRRRQVDQLMGSTIDALKLVSSMTLFSTVTRDAAVCDLPDIGKLHSMSIAILDAARGAGYPACERTLLALRVT